MPDKMKLTKRAVTAIKATGEEFAVSDAEVKGFYLRVGATGEKAYGFRYKRRGQTRRMKIGEAAVMTADEARREAVALRAAVNRGEDPARKRRDDREAETMADLWILYLERHAIPKKRARSVEEDKRLWRLHLAPAFAREAVKDVSRREIERLMAGMHATPGAANRTKALLSKMMNLAVGWEVIAANPCGGIEAYRENPKERKAMTADERRRLFEALEREALEVDEGGALIVELLAFTGARMSEALNATWSQFVDDGADGLVWVLQATNTKQKKINRKPLGAAMSERLKEWRRANPAVGVDWVFPSPRDSRKPRADIKSVWARVRGRAELGHVRLHDLRHDWISGLVQAGMPLEVAGRYAGHANVATTRRYAHIEEAVLREAADRREAMLSDARVREAALVVPFPVDAPQQNKRGT